MIADIAARFAVDTDLVSAIRTAPHDELMVGLIGVGLI